MGNAATAKKGDPAENGKYNHEIFLYIKQYNFGWVLKYCFLLLLTFTNNSLNN